ncbi:hypothetical protein H4R18_004105 [Coemansia javaensis]|uniref:Uncharacterized protein n=1 Tax=Coemansia javaensis TaxID=2761396 RepID=A0A9W8HD94_9FUNG|nr:hypothetical protein H4R18_004105 [Coemansia javaensis]
MRELGSAASGEWDADSELRQFSPGRYAMRQLGRSMSRNTRRLLAGRDTQPAAAGGSHEAGGGSHGAGGGSHEAGGGSHKAPVPSGVHRRSVSFGNLVVLPDMTSPSLALPRSPAGGARLSESTWDSAGSAPPPPPAARASSMRRRWLSGLAHHPLSTAIDAEAAPPPGATAAGGGSEADGPAEAQIRFADGGLRAQAQRESFSGPAQLDASANATESQTTGDPFQSRCGWQPPAAATPASALRPRRSSQWSRADVVPSAPLASGLVPRPSVRRGDSGSSSNNNNNSPGSGEAPAQPQLRLRGIARVIGNISRRLTRIRSNRSASQPATPSEVRQSMRDSAERRMLNLPSGAAHELYRFLVNPEDPVSDHEDPRPDSPVVRTMSTRRARHRRSPTFPSQSFAQLRGAATATAGEAEAQPQVHVEVVVEREARRQQAGHAEAGVETGAAGAAGPEPRLGSAPTPSRDTLDGVVQSAEYVTAEENNTSGSPAHDEYATPDEGPPRALRRSWSDIAGHGESAPALLGLQVPGLQAPDPDPDPDPGHGASASAPQMTNQGHDGSVSALVLEKLASNFSSQVRVSTRLATAPSDARSESSYGTFIRFHNSGELNGIFAGGRRQSRAEATQGQPRPVPTAAVAAAAASSSRSSTSSTSSSSSSGGHGEDQASALRLAPMTHSRGDDYTPLFVPAASTVATDLESTESRRQAEAAQPRHVRDRESIRRFIEQARAGRDDGARRRNEAEDRQRRQSNAQAGLDAALYIYGLQRRQSAAQQPGSDAPRAALAQGMDVPTQSTASGASLQRTSTTASTVMPVREPPPEDEDRLVVPPRRNPDWRCRETVFGVFDGPATADAALAGGASLARERSVPPAEIDAEARAPPAPPAPHGDRSAPMKRSQSFSHFPSTASPDSTIGSGGCWNIRRGRQAQAQAPPRPRNGFLSGVLGRLAAGHVRNKSSGDAAPARPAPRKLERRLPRHRDMAESRHRDMAEPRHRDMAEPRHRDMAEPRHRDMAEPRHRDTPEPLPVVVASAGSETPRPDGSDASNMAQPDPTSLGLLAQASLKAGPRHAAAAAAAAASALRGQTSSVAPDTVTAGGWAHTEWPHGRARRRLLEDAANSAPSSQATSSNGSYAALIASVNGNLEHMRHSGLPGFQTPTARTPIEQTPPASRPRQPDAAPNGNNSKTTPPLSVPCDSPVSDAETGRTQILPFSKASVHRSKSNASSGSGHGDGGSSSSGGDKAAAHCVRPSARPEIKDVRGIGWPAADAAKAGARSSTGAESSESGVARVLAAMGGLMINGAPPPPLAMPADAEPPAHDPRLLAMLVQRSPDPRNLIYDAGSHFGTMRSRGSPATEPARLDPDPDPDPDPEPTDADAADRPTKDPASAAPRVAPLLHGRRMGWTPFADAPEGSSPARNFESHVLGITTESEALAYASIQATPTASPAVAAQAPYAPEVRAAPAAPAAGGDAGDAVVGKTQSESGCAPNHHHHHRQARLSFQDYIEQQRGVARSAGNGQEQREFRVSLLGRKVPEHRGHRSRSWSMPDRHAVPRLPAASVPRIPARPAQEPSPLTQALLLQATTTIAAAPVVGTQQLARKSTATQKSASEDLEDAALFSSLLGDGAALTSPDAKVAHRQSGALQPGQTPPPPPPPLPLPFDPVRDTGDNGVPDTVLRAYMAGDFTAIERFFEHIMRLTTPSSVYDDEVSEDGDWSFGIEGPPPEILSQRAAAAAAAASASTETSSAEQLAGAPGGDGASSPRPAQSGATVQTVPVPGASPPDSTSDAEPEPEPARSGTSDRQAEQAAAAADDDGEPPAAPESGPEPEATGISEPPSPKAARRIAIPHSRLSQLKHVNDADRALATPEASASPEEAQGSPEVRATPMDSTAPKVDLECTDVASLLEAVNDAAIAAAALDSAMEPPGESQTKARASDAACIGPGRSRSHNVHGQQHPRRRQQQRPEAAGHRLPLPARHSGSNGRSESSDKKLLLAQLRVLETMIQKANIAESRLQPAPPPLCQARIAEARWSGESDRSSAAELDYGRIFQELRGSGRQQLPPARAPASAAAAAGAAALPNGRVNILNRLRNGQRARAMSPFYADAEATTAPFPSATDGALEGGMVPRTPMSAPAHGSLHNSAQTAAYAVGSSPSPSSSDLLSPDSSFADEAALRHMVRIAGSDRFRRTAKLLAQ